MITVVSGTGALSFGCCGMGHQPCSDDILHQDLGVLKMRQMIFVESLKQFISSYCSVESALCT